MHRSFSPKLCDKAAAVLTTVVSLPEVCSSGGIIGSISVPDLSPSAYHLMPRALWNGRYVASLATVCFACCFKRRACVYS